MSDVATIARDGPVTRCTFERPDRGNALSAAMVARLDAALAEAADDGTVLFVIAGAGRHLCTGFDLSGIDAETDDTLLARFVRIELLLQRLHDAPFATLALGRGRVTGAGADLFAHCEWRWIVDDAQFSFPGVRFGLALGTARLAATVGIDRARRWILGGVVVDADEALAAGLATSRIVAADVDAAIRAAATSLASVDAITRAAIRSATRRRTREELALDLQALVGSAARPGLRDRIVAYRAASARAPAAIDRPSA